MARKRDSEMIAGMRTAWSAISDDIFRLDFVSFYLQAFKSACHDHAGDCDLAEAKLESWSKSSGLVLRDLAARRIDCLRTITSLICAATGSRLRRFYVLIQMLLLRGRKARRVYECQD